jgi:hypothetical protein
VPQKFLDGADVIVVLQEVSGEGMAEGVRANPLGNARLLGRSPDGLLQAAFPSSPLRTGVQVVAAHNATAGVYG